MSDDFFDLRENLQKNLEENFVKAQQFIRIFPVFFFFEFHFSRFFSIFFKRITDVSFRIRDLSSMSFYFIILCPLVTIYLNILTKV